MIKTIFNSSAIIFFVFQSFQLFAQGELDEQKKIFFRNEKSGAFSLNSNGWGLNYRYAKRINEAKKWMYDADFNVMKHPKEVKEPNTNSFSRYVYGKKNYVINLQGSLGRQNEFYGKRDIGSVSIRGFYSLGMSLAVLKPIYYDVQVSEFEFISQKFDPSMQPGLIQGRSAFFKGIEETKVIPGGFGRAGFSFEFGKEDQIIRALDFGVTLSIYPKTIDIMAEIKNSAIFPTVFLAWRMGKVVSGHNFDEAKKNAGEEF